MKSPLSLPSRRYKSTTALRSLIPTESIVHCYVTYDGELEIDLASSGRYVVGHTNCYSIYEFWTCVFHNPDQVSKVINHFDNIEDRNIFYTLQDTLPNYSDPFLRSGIFFLLCKFSETGRASSGAFTPGSYEPTFVNNLFHMPTHSMKVTYDECDNYLDAILNNKLRCDYVVIPAGHFQYDILNNSDTEKSQYDETPISHQELKNILSSSTEKIALLYHFTPVLLKYYKDYKIHLVDKWGQITKRQDKAQEVIVANF